MFNRVKVGESPDSAAARAAVLMDSVAAARASGALLRWALELQAVVHDRNGNYLFLLYLVLRNNNIAQARELAEMLSHEGIAVGPSSGHFEHLEHLDPGVPLPPELAAHGAVRARGVQGVEVRGAVVDGIVKVSTAYIP